MKIFYINREFDQQRRLTIEQNLLNCTSNKDEITRVEAIEPGKQGFNNKGRAKPKEKALHCSHINALKLAQGSPEEILILEDDAKIEKTSIPDAENAINVLNKRTNWDLLYGDLLITTPTGMYQISKILAQSREKEKYTIFNLRKSIYAGSTALFINRKSIKKLLELLDQDYINYPIDMALRRLSWEGLINAYTTVPFLTSISDYADRSTIQNESDNYTDYVWNTYRMMLTKYRRMEIIEKRMRYIESQLDREAEIFGNLIMSHQSKKFVPK